MLSGVDSTSVILLVVAVLAALTAAFLGVRNHRHGRAVDQAIERVSGVRPARRWNRADSLVTALDRLERSTARAQRERAQLAGAVETAPLGIIVTDDDGVVITANAAAGRYLGARLGEAVAEVRIRQAIDRAILQRGPVEVEVDLYTPVRSVLEVTAIPLDFGIESLGAVAFVSDVTKSRRVAAMRRDFIANVSHELKTPLAALSVLAETLAAGIEDRRAVATLAQRLQKESLRLSHLVDDILDLSQAEAATARREPVALNAIAEKVAAELGALARERGVELVVEPVPLQARVAGDARQLQTMITNLVDNGIKYSRSPTEAASPPRVVLSISVDDGKVVIEVSDEGIGISEAHLDRIFERFYRVDRARSRDTGGTGLGLSIVRNVALNHRGEVTVESAEGEGSTFRVTLPRWESA